MEMRMASNVMDMDKVILTDEQKKFYWDNGYLVLGQLIDFATLYSCKQRFIKICKGVVDKSVMVIVKEVSLIEKGVKGEDLINKIQEILYDEVFSTYTENPVLLSVVSQLIGDELTAAHSMLINKPPGTGRHPPHQDLYFFPFRPANRITAAWTAIDDVTKQNGCLYVIPGSHKRECYEHGYPLQDGKTNKMYHGILEEDLFAPTNERVDLEMSPGDTVLFHPLLVHGSRPNFSKRYRKSICCHYIWSGCEYIDVRGTMHEKVAKEVEDLIRTRGFNMEFRDFWKLKSKQVKGAKSHL